MKILPGFRVNKCNKLYQLRVLFVIKRRRIFSQMFYLYFFVPLQLIFFTCYQKKKMSATVAFNVLGDNV